VERALGWPYEGPEADVAIVRNRRRMQDVAQANVPDWAVGVALPTQARIVIRADLLEMGYGSSLEAVLRHEWVHLAWGRHAGARRRFLPLWAEEGLAEEIGGGISIDAGAALDVAAAFGRLLHFADLEERFPQDREAADLAYKQSRSWIHHFVTHAGWPVFREILGDVATGVGGNRSGPRSVFAEAVRRRTGLSLGEWHAQWQQALEDKASPWFHLLLRDFSGLLFALVAVVGAGAFFFLWRRRRREIEALPDVREEDDLFGEGDEAEPFGRR